MDAQLRYYYRMPQAAVDALSDHQWAEHWQDLLWVRQQEARRKETTESGGA